MTHIGTKLNVIDNSGVKVVYCIGLGSGFKKRCAGIGDLVVVVVKELRSYRKAYSFYQKGDILFGLLVRGKFGIHYATGETVNFLTNAVILLEKTEEGDGCFNMLSTRIYGFLPKQFRYSKFMRIVALASGTE